VSRSSFPWPADDCSPPPLHARRALDGWDDEEEEDAADAVEASDDATLDDGDDAEDDTQDEPVDDDPDASLDEDFPLGDGVADRAATVYCPYCGEPSEVAVDPGGGAQQEYVEDCPVCCRPWRVTVSYQPDGTADVWAHTDDE